MWLFGKKKEELLIWQNLIMQDSPNKLVMTEKQLKQTTEQQASNDLRIIQDCIRIISETVKPDIFFSRMDLLKEKSKRLIEFEKYIKFSGASPTNAFQEVLDNEQDAIYQFISRCFNVAFEKAESMKTEKGKMNQFQKFYDNLQPYMNRMDEKNRKYIEWHYNHSVSKNSCTD